MRTMNGLQPARAHSTHVSLVAGSCAVTGLATKTINNAYPSKLTTERVKYVTLSRLLRTCMMISILFIIIIFST